jgi:ATP-dependent RNA helicase DHX8/PRP22
VAEEIKAHQAEVGEYKTGKVKHIDEIKLVITQPRRMAAVSMAMRLCYERTQELGQQIGYTIRFDDKTSSATRLKYVTDGIFVRECINDPYLFKYQIVILDEAHERSLYTDILFALIKKAVEYRKGTLKLIITSATLNTKTFSNYYNNCPVLQMHGKLFPVEVKYFPIHHAQRVE